MNKSVIDKMTKEQVHKKSIEAAKKYLTKASKEELIELRTPDPNYNGVTYGEYLKLIAEEPFNTTI